MSSLRAALVCLLACLSHGSAGTIEEANQLYQKGDAAQAARAYEALLSQGPSPALYFNLGNAHFKQASPGSLGRAVAAYLQAYELLPRDPDIRHNLEFALRRSGENLVPSGMPRILHRLFYFLSWKELLGLQWILYWLMLLTASLGLLVPPLRPKLRPVLATAFACWAAAGSWLALRASARTARLGVVVTPAAEARSGPGTNFPVGFSAPEGRRVCVLAESGDWLEIGTLKEGLKGWTEAKNIQRIKT